MRYSIVSDNSDEDEIQLRLSSNSLGEAVVQGRFNRFGNWLNIVTFKEDGILFIDEHDYARHLGLTIRLNRRHVNEN